MKLVGLLLLGLEKTSGIEVEFLQFVITNRVQCIKKEWIQIKIYTNSTFNYGKPNYIKTKKVKM